MATQAEGIMMTNWVLYWGFSDDTLRNDITLLPNIIFVKYNREEIFVINIDPWLLFGPLTTIPHTPYHCTTHTSPLHYTHLTTTPPTPHHYTTHTLPLHNAHLTTTPYHYTTHI